VQGGDGSGKVRRSLRADSSDEDDDGFIDAPKSPGAAPSGADAVGVPSKFRAVFPLPQEDPKRSAERCAPLALAS
jgi:hypothetical protein